MNTDRKPSQSGSLSRCVALLVAIGGVATAPLTAQEVPLTTATLVEDLWPGAWPLGLFQSSLAPGSFIGQAVGSFVATPSLLFFSRLEPAHGSEVWLTDGTQDGTRMLADLGPGRNRGSDLVAAVGGGVLIASSWGELRWTDGEEIRLLGRFLGPAQFIAYRGDVVFIGCTEDIGRCALWRTDGTVAGTARLTDELTWVPNQFADLVSAGDRLFLISPSSSSTSTERVLLGLDPETHDLVALTDREPGRLSLATTGEGLVFALDSDDGDPPAQTLWASDGSPAGTVELRRINGARYVGFPGTLDGDVVVVETVGAPRPTACRLLRSGGTPESTVVIAELELDELAGCPREGVAADGRIVFTHVTPGSGVEPWISDGTSEGTELLADLTPGEDGSFPYFYEPTELGVLFSAGDPSSSYLLPPDAETPVLLVEGASVSLFAAFFQGSLWFSIPRFSYVPTQGALALWASDGTAEGTAIRFELGPVPAPSNPQQLGRRTDDVVLLADIEPNRFPAPWVTDSTPAGTERFLVEPMPIPPVYPVFGTITPMGDFAIWVDGTTRFVSPPVYRLGSTPDDVTPLDGSSIASFPLDSLTSSSGGEEIVFDALDDFRGRTVLAVRPEPDPSSGVGPLSRELRLSDGTTTLTLRTFAPTFHGDDWQLTAVGDLLYLTPLVHSVGQEMWVSDGTPEGTRLLVDTLPGPESSAPHQLEAVDGRLLFAAGAPGIGSELWTTDGAADGTRLVLDLAEGPASGDPSDATPLGDRILFAGHRDDVGRELFSFDRRVLEPSCSTEVVTGSVCLGEDRFRVSVDWLDRVSGDRGRATGSVLTRDTASFWFFDEDNVELLVKVLDGRGINDTHWVYAGAVSDVAYWVTVFDTVTGESKTYENVQGSQCGVGDVGALPEDPERAGLFGLLGPLPPADPPVPGADNMSETCEPSETRLFLQDGRLAVEVEWTALNDPAGGVGVAVPATADSGYFWFFSPENVELIVKVLDARAVNGNFWVYSGALSDVAYTITVVDTQTGAVRVYENDVGSQCGRGDVDAFPEP